LFYQSFLPKVAFKKFGVIHKFSKLLKKVPNLPSSVLLIYVYRVVCTCYELCWIKSKSWITTNTWDTHQTGIYSLFWNRVSFKNPSYWCARQSAEG